MESPEEVMARHMGHRIEIYKLADWCEIKCLDCQEIIATNLYALGIEEIVDGNDL